MSPSSPVAINPRTKTPCDIGTSSASSFMQASLLAKPAMQADMKPAPSRFSAEPAAIADDRHCDLQRGTKGDG